MTPRTNRKLTPAQRDKLGAECYALNLEGKTNKEIAETMGMSHHTVAALLREHRVLLRERFVAEPERDVRVDALIRFNDEMEEIKNSLRRHLANLKQKSQSKNLPALMAEYIKACEKQATAYGVFEKKAQVDVNVNAMAWTNIMEQALTAVDMPLLTGEVIDAEAEEVA